MNWKQTVAAVIGSGFLIAAGAACGGKSAPAPKTASASGRASRIAKNDARLLFKMLVTIEALEADTGSSDTWKAAVAELPDSRVVALLNRTLGGDRFTAYDVEAGTKVYRARFLDAVSGDPTVEIVWSIDRKNYPVSIGAPEGYREAKVTDYLDRETKTLTAWNDGVIELVVTPDPVVIVWSKAVKASH